MVFSRLQRYEIYFTLQNRLPSQINPVRWPQIGAKVKVGSSASFLHTRSFNIILRRLGSGVKRNIPENQWFSGIFVGLIDPLVTPERLELSTHWLRVSCSTNWATESCIWKAFLSFCGAKLRRFFELTKFFGNFFWKNVFFVLSGWIWGWGVGEWRGVPAVLLRAGQIKRNKKCQMFGF